MQATGVNLQLDDFTKAVEITDATTTQSWYWVSSVDALAPPDATAIVAFGDSITDGATLLRYGGAANYSEKGEAIEMSTEKNKKVVRDFYQEVFHKHNLFAVSRFMHDDYIQHNPDADQGSRGFIEFHKGFFAAIPDHCATIIQMVAEGDLVYVYNRITGTHTEEGFLDHKPTGNKLGYDVVDMFRLRDGKLCEHWDVADTRALFSQVGAIKKVER